MAHDFVDSPPVRTRAASTVRAGHDAAARTGDRTGWASRLNGSDRVTQLQGLGERLNSPGAAGGLPTELRGGIEGLSGLSMADVAVHRNSSRPAQLQAKAYTEGSNIYLGPGQEQHLAHEAWHVVQQKQGRVGATTTVAGKAVNAEPRLELEADRMGAMATVAAATTTTIGPLGSARATSRPIVQGMFESLTDFMHNKRKVGVEITEATAGGNRMLSATPNGTWAGVPDKDSKWQTVQLPDETGTTTDWKVAPWATLSGHFATSGGKNKWMKWGDTKLTQDFGEYEWIVGHPDDPVVASEYRARLNQTALARAAFRGAVGRVAGAVIVSKNTDPGAGDAFYAGLGDTDACSSQITIESTDPAKVGQAIVDGLSFGLNRSKNPTRTGVPVGDPIITDYLNKAIRRVSIPEASMTLPVAYLMADLAHKIGTMGVDWSGDVAANFKDWRMLFPKSHPYHITQMAIPGTVTPLKVTAVRTALTTAKVGILRDVTEMVTKMIMKKGPRLEWGASRVDNTLPEYGRITSDLHGGGDLRQSAARTNDLEALIASHDAGFLGDAFDDTVAALTDSTFAANEVVRSGGFSQHAPTDKAFTFEDRAEVEDEFPALTATYDRVVTIVDRY